MTTFVYVTDVVFSDEKLPFRILGAHSEIINNAKRSVDAIEAITCIRLHHLPFLITHFLLDFVLHNISDDLYKSDCVSVILLVLISFDFSSFGSGNTWLTFLQKLFVVNWHHPLILLAFEESIFSFGCKDEKDGGESDWFNEKFINKIKKSFLSYLVCYMMKRRKTFD